MTPSGGQAPAAPPRPAALTPVVARPEVLPAPVGEIVPSIPESSGDPLAGLDIIEAAPAHDEPAQASGAEESAGARAPQGAMDWLSPEGALRGEFGDLVDHVPQRPNAKAPVFPTPPAPWPSHASNAAPPESAAAPDAALDDLDAGFEDVLGTAAAGGSTGAMADEPLADAGLGEWTPETSDRATPAEATSIPGMHDVTAAESEVWAESYGAQADAIHGELAPATPDAGAALPEGLPELPPPADPSTYLAAEWPDRPANDPSTMPTPIMPSPAILPGWEPVAANTAPAAKPATDPLFEPSRPGDEDAFGWGKTPQEAPIVSAAASAGDDWTFAAAGSDSDPDGRPVVTSSSLAAAEALERVAVQLRAGTLRADGFSPALGEAAALSAVLAALLGIDARWDVQR